MTRFVEWLRSLRLWFATQRELRAQVVRLDRALADERAEHYGQFADAAERYARDVAILREDNAAFRVECERLDRDVHELRHNLARATGKGVGHVPAAVRD